MLSSPVTALFTSNSRRQPFELRYSAMNLAPEHYAERAKAVLTAQKNVIKEGRSNGIVNSQHGDRVADWGH